MYSLPICLLQPTTAPGKPQRAHLSISQAGESIALISWSLAPWTLRMVSEHLGESWDTLHLILRLNDVTDIIFDGRNAHSIQWTDVTGAPGCWYARGMSKGRDYLAEIGAAAGTDGFIPMASSHPIRIL